MLPDELITELRLKVQAEAEKSDATYKDLFTSSGMNEEVAIKVATVLTNLALVGKVFASMGMPSQEIKIMISREFNSFVDNSQDVKDEVHRVFSSDGGMDLFIRASKMHTLKILRSEIERIEAELKEPDQVKLESKLGMGITDITSMLGGKTLH